MKRYSGFLLPLSAIAFGLVGFFLRRWQLDAAFEPDTGLLISGQPASFALVAAVIAAAAVSVGLAAALFRGGVPNGYLANLAAPNLAVGLLTLLAGAVLFAGGVLGIRDFVLHMDERVIRLVLGMCMALAGVCVGLVGLLGQQRKESKGRFHGALLAPGYGACVWLVAAYQGHAANPNIMEYVFLLLGIVCAIFAAYAAASFAFETPRPILCAVCSAMGVVLLSVSAADYPWGMDLLTILGFGAYLLAQLICLAACRVKPPRLEKWTPPPSAEEPKNNEQEQVQSRGEEDE